MGPHKLFIFLPLCLDSLNRLLLGFAEKRVWLLSQLLNVCEGLKGAATSRYVWVIEDTLL